VKPTTIKVKKAYQGNDAHRLKHTASGMERLFAKSFEYNNGHKTLVALLTNGEGGRPFRGPVTKRDLFIANTIIQWLGTNVGSNILYMVEQWKCKTCEGFGTSRIKFAKPCEYCDGTGFDHVGEGRIRRLILGDKK
jgi:DnaJ-class molecular chaperone